jgi:TonB family protein
MRIVFILLAGFIVGCSGPQYSYVFSDAGQSRVKAEQGFAANLPVRGEDRLQLDSPLRAIITPFPEWPTGLDERKNTGTVCVLFTIEEDGTTSNLTVVGSPPTILAELSLRAIARWRFEPPTAKGKAVRIPVQQTFEFHGE